MAMEGRCAACGKNYTNRPAARFCSAACKQRAAEWARDLAQREAERAREATRKAIDLAHALIG
jgi:hypothetical protein